MERASSTKFSHPQRSLSTLPIQQWYPQQIIINHSTKYLSPHRVSLPSMVARVFFSPQNLPFAKFIPQRSHLLLPVFLQWSSPAEAKVYSSTSAQDVASWHPSRIHFPKTKTYIHKHHTSIHYSMHIRIISHKLIYVENIITWSYHALHMTDLYLSERI